MKAVHQPTLLDAVSTVRTVSGSTAAGVQLPVARVAVDVSLPHLDRPFDYRVTPELDEAAQPGTRVSVRFAGIPLGHEFTSLVLALLQVGGHPSTAAAVMPARGRRSATTARPARSRPGPGGGRR